MHEHHKHIAVLYHGGCPDGFGGAYAAWKKLGDNAEYIPVKHENAAPDGLEGREIYMIDFCYPKNVMDEIQKSAQSLTVLDHHESMKEIIETASNHVYDVTRSGASLAWNYFHPSERIPAFLQYVENADLHRMVSDDERAVITYCYAQSFNFHTWDNLVERVQNPQEREKIIAKGKDFMEYFDLIINQLANSAELVSFEGYKCYLGAGERMFITPLGNYLARKQPPFALVVRAGSKGLRVSLRGDESGSVDLGKVAQKYGGNGHPNSAAFSVPWGTPVPWKQIEN